MKEALRTGTRRTCGGKVFVNTNGVLQHPSFAERQGKKEDSRRRPLPARETIGCTGKALGTVLGTPALVNCLREGASTSSIGSSQ